MPPDSTTKRLDHWKSKLIDLSLRNKLLNYRPGRSSAVPIVDEVPRVVVERLLADEEGFRFLPKPDDGPAQGGGDEFKPVPDDALAPNHKDDRLQTALKEKDLTRALYNLFLKSRTSFEEQGAVTLFLAVGMLEWYESQAASEAHVAPILLVPAVLSREGVGRPYTLRAAPQEPEVNPSLLRKLSIDFGIRPELPESESAPDPDAVLAAFAEKLPDDRWKVLSDMHLGLFSFSKYLMYRDLEVQAEALLQNPLVARLSGEEMTTEDPEPIPPRMLDDLRAPAQVHQILDADSSQQSAIESVRRGSHLVVQGPPGTGKSQTIANLVAETLADGRSVLFVSEKMAALEVVKRRLDQTGLGDYVLELHSRHAVKREVVRELARCLQRERTGAAERSPELDRLVKVRHELARYVEALHEPFGAGGLTPYEALGDLAELEAARDVWFEAGSVEDVAEDARSKRVRLLSDLSRARDEVAPANEHPFRFSRLTDVPRAVEVELRRALLDLRPRIADLATAIDGESRDLGVDAPEDLPGAENLRDVLRHLARSPRPEARWVTDPAWPGTTAEARALVSKGEKYAKGMAELMQSYLPTVFDLALDELEARRRSHGTGLLRLLRPSWWRDRLTLRTVRRPGSRRTNAEEIDDLAQAVLVRDLGAEIDAVERSAAEDYGRIWRGRDTDWSGLLEVGAWVDRLRDLVRPTVEIAEAAAGAEGLDRRAAKLGGARDELEKAIARLRELLRADDLPADLGELSAFAEDALARTEEIHVWAAYRRALETARESGLDGYLRAAAEADLASEELVPCYRKAFAGMFIDRVGRERAPIREFDGKRHEAAIRSFRELDEGQFETAVRRIRARLDADLPKNRSFSPKSDVGLLLREAAKKRRHLPIRQLLGKAGAAVRRLKPCFMMSPISVAQFLPVDSEPFDVVVFDEASQICPEDAIGAVARGRQLVVVGDSKQLPPTSFFTYDPDMEEDEEAEERPPDLESILDLCVTSGFPGLRLRWHYRSRDESLIAFSNHHFYDGALFTFPSPGGRPGLGVELIHVEDGIYDRGNTRVNREEAKRVADGIARHFRDQPELSVGAVTFSQAQQLAVLEELEALLAADRELEELSRTREDEPPFVKNLENVQGDERDVMFFSVGYGRDGSGKLTMNFGPLNGDGGHRRLNVAVTRARRAVRVYSSILPEDIDPGRARGRGARLLRSYLDYARRGTAALGETADPAADPDGSGRFEAAVARALEEEGFAVTPRVGASAYRLDLAVARPEQPDRYLFGVECDGATYRDAATARDRDRTRGLVLDRLGWKIERVWSPDWVKSPRREMERLANAGACAEPDEPIPPPEPGTVEAPETQDEPAVENAAPVEDAAPAVDALPEEDLPEAPPYLVTPRVRRKPRKPFSPESEEIPKLVAAVVEFEAPVHVEEVVRRVADSYEQRLTQKVREAIEAAVDAVVREGRASRRDDFLRRPGDTTSAIRGRLEDGSLRRIEHVPPEEIEDGVRVVLEVDLRMPKEPLAKAIGGLLGHRRASEPLLDRIGGVLEAMRERGALIEEGGNISLT